MKRISLGLTALMLIPACFNGQTDIYFLQGVNIQQHLTHQSPSALHENPSVRLKSNGICWGLSIHNHFEIPRFNTLGAAAAFQNNKMVFSATCKHTTLGDIGYHRSAASAGIALKMNDHWQGGTALQMATFKLPENLGRTTLSGITIGLSGNLTTKTTCQIAGCFWQPLSSPFDKQKPITRLNGSFFFKQSDQCTIGCSVSMTEGLHPLWMTSVLLFPLPGITLTCGAGNGLNMLNIGLLFNFQKFAIGTVTASNPRYGRSHTLLINNSINKDE